MKWKLLFGVMIVGVLAAGCSTAMPPVGPNNVQVKVAQLERKVDERDRVIEELRYEVRELAGQVEGMDSGPIIEPIEEASYEGRGLKMTPSKLQAQKDGLRIIRVAVSAKKVQAALKNAGYYEGSIDGKLGSKSRGAIKKFQKEHELKADGIIGKKTWTELKNYLN